MSSIAQQPRSVLSIFEETQLDCVSVPSEHLDLVGRKRKSLFPWRGQFSPELVQLLLSKYAASKHCVLDPFLGSGTTLFECARRDLAGVGVEINPAAVMMARTAEFAEIGRPGREECLARAESVLTRHGLLQPSLLTTAAPTNTRLCESVCEQFQEAVQEARGNSLLLTVVANVLMGCSPAHTASPESIARSFRRYASIVQALPVTAKTCRVIHCDAREVPLGDGSIDLILTSPPYVNVFNYHQNHRPALELMGWDLLKVAKSEIGSNRKNRGNRFLTVIQYSLDMTAALREARRLLNPSGRLIVVIGRESTVRGVTISNSRLLSAIAWAMAGLNLLSRQERKFTNRFGELIYEDILHFAPSPTDSGEVSDARARELACQLLADAPCPTADVRRDVESAISLADLVQPSPIFAASEWPS